MIDADDDLDGWFSHRTCATCRKAWRRDLALYLLIVTAWMVAAGAVIWTIVWMPPA